MPRSAAKTNGQYTGTRWLNDLIDGDVLPVVAREYKARTKRGIGVPALLAVATALAHHAMSKANCWPSRDTIAAKSGVGLSQVAAALSALEQAGLIRRTRRKNGSVIYTLIRPETLRPSGGPDSAPAEPVPPPQRAQDLRSSGHEHTKEQPMEQSVVDGAPAHDTKDMQLVQLLRRQGIQPNTASDLVAQYTPGQIREAVRRTKEAGDTIKNPAGFIITQLRNGIDASEQTCQATNAPSPVPRSDVERAIVQALSAEELDRLVETSRVSDAERDQHRMCPHSAPAIAFYANQLRQSDPDRYRQLQEAATLQLQEELHP